MPVFFTVTVCVAFPPQATVLATEAGVTASRPAFSAKSASTTLDVATVTVAVPEV